MRGMLMPLTLASITGLMASAIIAKTILVHRSITF